MVARSWALVALVVFAGCGGAQKISVRDSIYGAGQVRGQKCPSPFRLTYVLLYWLRAMACMAVTVDAAMGQIHFDWYWP